MMAMCFKKYPRSIVTIIYYLNVLYAMTLYRYARCDEDPQNVPNSEAASNFEYNPGHFSVDLTGIGPPKRKISDFQGEKPKFTEHVAIREKGFMYVPHSNEQSSSKNVSAIPQNISEKVPENLRKKVPENMREKLPENLRKKVPEDTIKDSEKENTNADPESKSYVDGDRTIRKNNIIPTPIINTDKHTLLEFEPTHEISGGDFFENERKIPSDYICQDNLENEDPKLKLTAPFPLPTETSIEDGTSPLIRRGSRRQDHDHHHPLCEKHRRMEERLERPKYENQPDESSYFGNRDGITDDRIRIFAVFRRRRDTEN